MKPRVAVAMCLVLLSAGAANAAGSGTFGSSQGPWRSASPPGSVKPPRPPSAPVSPSYKSSTGEDRFRPFRGTHVDSTRGGVDAYPHAKKPKGYISPY